MKLKKLPKYFIFVLKKSLCACIEGGVLHRGRIHVMTDRCSAAAEALRPTVGADLRPPHSTSAGPRSRAAGFEPAPSVCFKYAAELLLERQKRSRPEVNHRGENVSKSLHVKQGSFLKSLVPVLVLTFCGHPINT